MLTQNDLDWYAARLAIAVYDVRKLTPEMSVLELREALKDIPGAESLTIAYTPKGNQAITCNGTTVEVGPMASNEEIRAALQNPFIPTKNTKVIMVSPLQGLGDRLKKLKHDSELDANKLVSRIDAVSARKDAAMAKSHNALDGQEKDIADVEAFVADIEKQTNGGPA